MKDLIIGCFVYNYQDYWWESKNLIVYKFRTEGKGVHSIHQVLEEIISEQDAQSMHN